MQAKGIIRGRRIELDEALPLPEGQAVQLSIQPLANRGSRSVDRILNALESLPPIDPDIVDEMMRAIDAGQLPPSRPPHFGDAA